MTLHGGFVILNGGGTIKVGKDLKSEKGLFKVTKKGTIKVAGNATFSNKSVFELASDNQLTSSSTLTFDDSAMKSTGGAVSGKAVVLTNAASYTASSTGNQLIATNGVTLSNGSTLTVSASGALTIASEAATTANAARTTATTGLILTGTLDVNNSTLKADSVNVEDGGTLTLSNKSTVKSYTDDNAGAINISSGGTLVVDKSALTSPAEGSTAYTSSIAKTIANSGTVRITGLTQLSEKTTIKLATDSVTAEGDAKWELSNPLYTLSLAENVLSVAYDSTTGDQLLANVDEDLAGKIENQARETGFDDSRNDGLGFISKVMSDTVLDSNGSVDLTATANRVGRTLSSATRFATLAGAAQNTQVASDMVTAQIEERSGFRTATASRMTSENGEAGALWASLLYNKARSNGFAAGAYTYGMDTDLYGMSFGADAAVAEGLRVGAAFSGGTGDSDTKGSLMKTTNDFDFYSGSLYAITDVGSVTVLTDLDYTWLKGDVKQTNNITTLKSTVKSSVASVGVSAKRAFETEGGVTVAPYAGVRVNRLHVKGYDVKDSANNTILKAGSQHQYYATVPVGVQVSKAFELTNGFVKPALDLGLVTTVGSRNLESRVTYTGFGETKATSEVRDRTAFTVKFGVNGEVGNFGFGVGYGFAGSQSTTNHQVYGNVRYRF